MSVKRAIIILLILAILGGGTAYILASRKNNANIYTTEKVRAQTIIQTVSETGTIKAAQDINLSFQNAGKIDRINIKVGDKVKKGDELAALDYSGLEIKKAEAQASLDVDRQSLNKLLAGAVKEDIALSQANVSQAKAALEAAKDSLGKIRDSVDETIKQAAKTVNDLESSSADDITTYEQAIATAKTILDNDKETYQAAIDNYKSSALVSLDDKLASAHTALDKIRTTIDDEDARNLISIKDISYLTKTNENYDTAFKLLTQAEAARDSAKTKDGNDYILEALDEALNALNKISDALKSCFSALENSGTSSSYPQASLDTAKTNISSQQTVIAASITAIETAKQNLNTAILNYNTNVKSAQDGLAAAKASYDNALLSAKNALATAQVSGEQKISAAKSQVKITRESYEAALAGLRKTIAPANQHDIALARAKVKQAQAGLESILNQINDSIIIAPIDGTITKSDYEAGEQASLSAPIITMVGDNNIEIEVLISESDIAKVRKNDSVEITLDAFGEGVKFSGRVNFIEPAATIIQDVIYYKVTILFNPNQKNKGEMKQIKPGMTANVIISTARKENVLAIPFRAIVEKSNGQKIVRVLVGNKLLEKPVVTGLRGDEGLVEIISGLKAGENIVTYIKGKK